MGETFHVEIFLGGGIFQWREEPDFPALFEKRLEIKLKREVFSTQCKAQH